MQFGYQEKHLPCLCDGFITLKNSRGQYNSGMVYNFDLTPDRHQSESFKWQTYPPDVIPLWVADMDFCSPEPVIQALQNRVAHGVFGYPRDLHGWANEAPELAELFVKRLADRYHWEVPADALVFFPGVVTAFNLASMAFAAPLGGILIQTPVYPPILTAAHTTNVISQQVELLRQLDGSYQVDWESFEAAFTDQTRMFILCNPHNPIGKMFSQEELSHMAEICLRRNVIICSDEIHCDLVYPGCEHVPVASLDPEIAARTITLMAPSKTYNLAGLQCSIAIIQNPELRKQLMNARKGLVPWVNLLGLVAAQAAYQDGQEWLDQLLVYLHGNRDCLHQFIQTKLPAIEIGLPQATYLAWLDCRASNIAGSPYQFFLEKAGVALNNGATFGVGGEGFVRLNFGCSRILLLEALERMKFAVDRSC